MRNIFSKRQFLANLPYAYLCVIWYIDADQSYHIVKRPGITESDYIAVRTISGCGILTEYNGEKHELKANSLGIFCSGDVAQYKASLEGWQFYWFRFNHSDWREKCNWVEELNITASELKNMERCFSNLNSKFINECLNAEALFNFLLSDWMIRLHSGTSAQLSASELTAILEKGCYQQLDLKTLAKTAGMCERSFRDAVHRVTGMSPKEYMSKLKMDAAMDLLLTTTKSVSEIAEEMGYETPFYFSRAFKKHYGISPKKVRNGIFGK